MKTRTRTAIFSLFAGVAAISVWVVESKGWERATSSREHLTQPPRDDQDALLAEVVALRQRVAALELRASFSALSRARDELDRQHDERDAPHTADAPSSEASQGDRLDAEFLREPEVATGDAISTEVESQIREILPGGADVSRVECRGPLCRVETTHQGMRSYTDYVEALNRKEEGARRGGVSYAPIVEPSDRDRGTITSVAYLSHE